MKRKPRHTISLNYLEVNYLIQELAKLRSDYIPIVNKLLSARQKLQKKIKTMERIK